MWLLRTGSTYDRSNYCKRRICNYISIPKWQTVLNAWRIRRIELSRQNTVITITFVPYQQHEFYEMSLYTVSESVRHVRRQHGTWSVNEDCESSLGMNAAYKVIAWLAEVVGLLLFLSGTQVTSTTSAVTGCALLSLSFASKRTNTYLQHLLVHSQVAHDLLYADRFFYLLWLWSCFVWSVEETPCVCHGIWN